MTWKYDADRCDDDDFHDDDDEGNINEALNSLGPLLCRQKRRLERSKMTRPSDNDDDDSCIYDYDNWMMMSMIKSMMKNNDDDDDEK